MTQKSVIVVVGFRSDSTHSIGYESFEVGEKIDGQPPYSETKDFVGKLLLKDADVISIRRVKFES